MFFFLLDLSQLPPYLWWQIINIKIVCCWFKIFRVWFSNNFILSLAELNHVWKTACTKQAVPAKLSYLKLLLANKGHDAIKEIFSINICQVSEFHHILKTSLYQSFHTHTSHIMTFKFYLAFNYKPQMNSSKTKCLTAIVKFRLH